MADSSNPATAIAYLAFVAAAAVGVYSFVTIAKDGEMRRNCSAECLLRPAYAGADRSVPNFELPDMNNHPVSIQSYRGKVVVLNFWTKTCGPCMQEMPEIAELTHVLADRTDVAVLTVSADVGPQDVRDTLASVLRGEKVPFPVLFDPEMKVIGDKFGSHLFPETWIIDKKGVIRARVDGARPWSNAMVVEFIDDLRTDGYCPLDISDGHQSGKAANVCKELLGT
jgi:peroxiredoxin